MENLRDLSEICLGQVLMEQILARRTCSVLAIVEEGLGRIYARGGEVIHAELGPMDPEQALFSILLSRSGRFRIQPIVWDGERTIQGDLSRLHLPRTAPAA